MKVAKFAATIVASVYSGGAAMAAQLAKEAAIKKAKQEAIKKNTARAHTNTFFILSPPLKYLKIF